MDATLAIAILGAVTGTAASAAQVAAFVRDRPRILLNCRITKSDGQKPAAWIDVTNAGRQPTTLREVGFYGNRTRVEIRSAAGDRRYTATPEVTFPVAKKVFLEPGQSEELPATVDPSQWGIHADFPLRLYASDIHGDKVWGDALPVVRIMVGEDPPLRDSDPEDLKAMFAAHDDVLYPAQVEPKWKVWKRRELRRPEAWKQ